MAGINLLALAEPRFSLFWGFVGIEDQLIPPYAECSSLVYLSKQVVHSESIWVCEGYIVLIQLQERFH